MKLMKVFEYEEFPMKSQEQITDYYEEKIDSDCYIRHSCSNMGECKDRLNFVDNFLIQKGIEDGEYILIHVSW
jgi:hypothetical protein